MDHTHAAVWAVGAGFIALGLLQWTYQAWGPLNWVIAGIVAFLVGGPIHDQMCKGK